MLTVKTHRDASDQYIGEVFNSQQESLYLSYKYSTESQAVEDARRWINWFEKVSSGTVESIYYIVSVPETWAGPPPKAHGYSGLQVKIGRTKNVLRRLQNLRTGTSGQLIIHALEPGNSRVEKELHVRFKSDRRQGEWFACSPDLVKHIFKIWNHYRVLPHEHQNSVLALQNRIEILRMAREVFDGVPDMVNPSLNEPWVGKVFIDLVHPRWTQN